MKRIITVVILVGIVVGIGATIVYLRKKSEKPPVVFETESPMFTDIVRKTVATGSIVPREEVEIKPKISGILEKIYVEPGDRVVKGTKIARVQVVPDMISLANAQNRVTQAKISLKNAQSEFDRRAQLLDQKLITEIEFEQFLLNLNQAKEEVAAAEDQLLLIKKGASKRSGANGNILITSTITGMVLDIPEKEGASVIQSNNFNAGTTVAFVANMGEMVFEGILDESEVGKVKKGMPLELTVGAIDGQKFEATLEYIAPKGVEENGAINFDIKANVKLEEGFFLRAGYSANASIILEKRDSVLAINESLLQFDEEKKPYVEIETGPQQFKQQYVTVGLSDGINVEVLKGIRAEDKIKKWDILQP